MIASVINIGLLIAIVLIVLHIDPGIGYHDDSLLNEMEGDTFMHRL